MFIGRYEDFSDFVEKNKGVLFRVWRKDYEDEDAECDYEYIRFAIPLGKDYLVGLEGYGGDNDLEYIEFELLSDLHLAYCNKDQDEE